MNTPQVNPLLRETEIRPDELRAHQQACFAQDVERLTAQKAAFVEVGCPACASQSATVRFQKFGLNYLGCTNCETVYISPRPTPAILEDFYAHSKNYEFWNSHIFPASEAARRAKIFQPRALRTLEICRRYGVENELLVEIGAGFGTFCEEIQSCGFFRRVLAIEPTPSLAQTCAERGLEVLSQPFEQCEVETLNADVAVAFEVIEHLFAPREFFLKCHQMLRAGGLILVTCPNIKGFDIQTLGVFSDAVDCEHLNYFHPQSLSQLAGNCGFQVLETLTPGKLDAELVRKKVIDGEFSLESQSFLSQILLEQWENLGDKFQAFLAENGLSSHLWLVARKV